MSRAAGLEPRTARGAPLMADSARPPLRARSAVRFLEATPTIPAACWVWSRSSCTRPPVLRVTSREHRARDPTDSHERCRRVSRTPLGSSSSRCAVGSVVCRPSWSAMSCPCVAWCVSLLWSADRRTRPLTLAGILRRFGCLAIAHRKKIATTNRLFVAGICWLHASAAPSGIKRSRPRLGRACPILRGAVRRIFMTRALLARSTATWGADVRSRED
jgi:hypothetical protein